MAVTIFKTYQNLFIIAMTMFKSHDIGWLPLYRGWVTLYYLTPTFATDRSKAVLHIFPKGLCTSWLCLSLVFYIFKLFNVYCSCLFTFSLDFVCLWGPVRSVCCFSCYLLCCMGYLPWQGLLSEGSGLVVTVSVQCPSQAVEMGLYTSGLGDSHPQIWEIRIYM